jgi:hypothetical protein
VQSSSSLEVGYLLPDLRGGRCGEAGFQEQVVRDAKDRGRYRVAVGHCRGEKGYVDRAGARDGGKGEGGEIKRFSDCSFLFFEGCLGSTRI